MIQIYSEVKTQEGTSNPWATSSTDKYTMLVHSKLDEEGVRTELYKDKFKSHPQAPVCYGITSFKQTKKNLSNGWKEYEIDYYYQVYYN